jgi:hypothetical protein
MVLARETIQGDANTQWAECVSCLRDVRDGPCGHFDEISAAALGSVRDIYALGPENMRNRSGSHEHKRTTDYGALDV